MAAAHSWTGVRRSPLYLSGPRCGRHRGGATGTANASSTDYGLTSLRAPTAPDILASQAVLTRAGFVLAGSVELDGQPEVRFVWGLTVDGTGRPADE